MEMDLLVGVATLALAAGTFWLARETRQMAASTKQMLELEAQPHLGLREIQIGHENPPSIAPAVMAQIGLRLWNPGKVLVQFRVDSITASINGHVPPQGAKFSNRGGVIHPGGETTFFYPPIVVSAPLPSPSIGRVQYELAYWAVRGEEHSFKAALDLTIRFPPNPNCTWVFTSGPDYS
jgi:hypothetical protein